MEKILVAGAGKSSPWLIKYLLQYAVASHWEVIVADGNAEAIRQRIDNHPNARAVVLDINNEKERQALVKEASIVVSLMPPHLHILLAKDCLQFGKNLITSSYISPEMKEMDEAVKKAGLMFMCEMGLDPGIDHMSAMKLIHGIRRVAGFTKSFKSYAGGLVAPESDDNPWHYKFSWNPKNVVDAGKAGAAYLQNGKPVEIPYESMFVDNKTIEVDGFGKFAWYANRDSLKYVDLYKTAFADTFLRATLRHPDFCKGWGALVKLGATDSTAGPGGEVNTYSQWISQLSNYSDSSKSLQSHVESILTPDSGDVVINMLEWLGLFSNQTLPADRSSNGAILLQLLEEKWVLKPEDKDMVIMQHEIDYERRGDPFSVKSWMVVKGENSVFTAMAKTVGLPIGILTRLLLNNKVTPIPGVLIPDMPAIYRPVLAELEQNGIIFNEEII